MSNYDKMKRMLIAMSGQDRALTIPKPYIELLDGDLEAALFLNQCVYWSDKGKKKDGTFYKSYKDWQEETYLTRYKIDRIRKVVAPYVHTELHRENGAPTISYTVDFGALTNAFSDLLETDKSNCKEEANPFVGKEQMLNIEYNIDNNTDYTPTGAAEVLSAPAPKPPQPTPSAAAAEPLPARPNIFTLYEQNIGALTPILSEKLMDAERSYPPAWIPLAFEKAVTANARSWNYIASVLNTWQTKGFDGDQPKPAPKQAQYPAKRNLLQELANA